MDGIIEYCVHERNTISYIENVDNRGVNDLWKRALEAQRDNNLPETQVGVADSTGIKQPSTQRWASGEGLPTMRQARAFALATGINVDWFLTGRPPKSPLVRPTTAEAQWIDILNNLDDDVRDEVLRYAQFRKRDGE